MKIFRVAIILFLLANLIAIVEAKNISTAQFLKLGAGARAAALGDAFTAISDDVTAAYWNPAGLTQLKTTEVSLMQNSGLVSTNYQYAGAAFPTGHHTVALSIYRMDYGTIDRYTAGDVRDGSFGANSLAAAFSVGGSFSEELRWGLSAKLIQETIESDKASGLAGDFGFLYRLGRTSFGLTAQNIGTGLTFVKDRSNLPITVRAGASRKFMDDKLQLGLDFSKPNDDNLSLHTGAEYLINPFFTIRGGYQATPGNSISVSGLTGVCGGVGINFRAFSLDYAFTPFGDLGNSQRVSILIRFGSN